MERNATGKQYTNLLSSREVHYLKLDMGGMAHIIHGEELTDGRTQIIYRRNPVGEWLQSNLEMRMTMGNFPIKNTSLNLPESEDLGTLRDD